MSVTFHVSNEKVLGTIDYRAAMNLANVNARALLIAMGYGGVDFNYGSLTLSDARRGVLRARNANPPEGVLRRSSDTKRPGQCRVLEQGLDQERLDEYLARFELLIQQAEAVGAERIDWS